MNEEIFDVNEANEKSRKRKKELVQTKINKVIKSKIDAGENEAIIDIYYKDHVKDFFNILEKYKEKGYRICYSELPRKPRMLASGMNWQNNLKNT